MAVEASSFRNEVSSSLPPDEVARLRPLATVVILGPDSLGPDSQPPYGVLQVDSREQRGFTDSDIPVPPW